MNKEVITILNAILHTTEEVNIKERLCSNTSCRQILCCNCPLDDIEIQNSSENNLTTQIHKTMETLSNEVRNPTAD